MGWNLNELTSSADAPAAAGDPRGCVFAAQGTQHVVYCGTDHHIHELRWSRNGWRHHDLTAASHGPAAAGDPAAWVWSRAGTQHVVHAGRDGHLHELRREAGVWRHRDLGREQGRGITLAGNPSAYVFDRDDSQHVTYRDTDGRLHELVGDAQGWRHEDLTAAAAGAPPAASDPVGFSHEARSTRHVVYRGAGGRVHELRRDDRGWRHSDLTAIADGAPPAAGEVTGYVFTSRGTQHVTYRSGDEHVHELWHDDQGWHHLDLTAETGAPPAAGDPAAYLFNLQGTQHVLYRASDDRLHELWHDVNGWHHDAMGAIGPAAAGRPAGYSFEGQKTQHAVYRQTDGRVDELWWQPDGSGTGGSGPSPTGGAIAIQWDPIVFDGNLPVGGAASLTVQRDGSWAFSGQFHDSGFAAYDVAIVWALRTAKGTLFTFARSGHVDGTLGAGSRDFTWSLEGASADIWAAWSEIQEGWSWQAQAGTGLELGKVWGDVRGAIGDVHLIVSVVGPLFA